MLLADAAPFIDTTAGQITVGVVVTIAGAAIVALGARFWRIGGAFRDFTEDWRGEPARPGYPGRPGVMQRLASQDDALAALKTQVASITDEMPKNGVPLSTKIDALWTKYLDDQERAHAALDNEH